MTLKDQSYRGQGKDKDVVYASLLAYVDALNNMRAGMEEK